MDCNNKQRAQWKRDNPAATKRYNQIAYKRIRNKPELVARHREANKARYHRNKHKISPEARRNARLLSDYHIDLVTYNAMLAAQSGLCAICYRPPNTRGVLYVDHCHKTGRVRQLLCQKCNSAIGMLNDDPRVMLAALAYIRKHAKAAQLENASTASAVR